MERLCIFIHIYNKPYISLWPIRNQFDMDLARAPRRARLTARKKGSGYENGSRVITRDDECSTENYGHAIYIYIYIYNNSSFLDIIYRVLNTL